MRLHYGRHFKERNHKCNVCGKTYVHASELKSHSKRHPNKGGTFAFTCEVCGRGFNIRCLLRRHERSHSTHEPFVCEVTGCNAKFKQKISLSNHTQVIHEGKNKVSRKLKILQCEICGNHFEGLHVLTIHQLVHSDQLKYSCSICDAKFVREDYLREHLKKNIHRGQRRYNPRPVDILKHQNPEEVLRCSFCARRFTKPQNLKTHEEQHSVIEVPANQDQPKLFKCVLCGKGFKAFRHLCRHKEAHSGAKPFACDQCDRRFNRPSHLRLHQRTHTGEKAYFCSICGKAFAHSSGLSAHRESVHFPKSQPCNLCWRTFNVTQHLRTHQRLVHNLYQKKQSSDSPNVE